MELHARTHQHPPTQSLRILVNCSDGYVATERRIPLHLLKRAAYCMMRPSAASSGRHLALLLAVLGCVATRPVASAQTRFYGGVLTGVATLSGDARSLLQPPASSASSLYDPRNGVAFSAVFGRDISEYFSLQADYVWNRNRLTLSSNSTANGTLTAYQELRRSSQKSALVDALLYFRTRESRFRPYLSVGTGWVNFSSAQEQITQSLGTPALPPRTFRSNLIALHVPVGIDVGLGKGWKFRYTFSETLTGNPISERLSPPGRHHLMNFESLFGIVRQF